MFTFRQWLIVEELNGVYLKPKSAGPKDTSHEWELHHPEFGHIGTMHLDSAHWNKDKRLPMQHARVASMTIHSKFNPAVPDHEISGHTSMGPQYNVGPKTTRKLLGHVAQNYPHLQTIQATRTTGARGDYRGNGSNGEAVVNLARLRKHLPPQPRQAFPTSALPPRTRNAKPAHPNQHDFEFMHDHDDLPF
jgi:hypothetical protein